MASNTKQCRKKPALPPTSSPYFAKQKDDTKKNAHAKKKTLQKNDPRNKRKRNNKGITSSRHFTTSPSSAVSSVLTLGSFLSTLSYEKIQDSEQKSKLDKAASHFQHCPIFAKKYSVAVAESSLSFTKQTNTKDGEDSVAKEEEEEEIIHKSVRHICPHGCYLRAYAAVREWHSLRAAIYELSGCSPDRILKGWKCYLLPPQPHDRRRSRHNEEVDENLASVEEKSNVKCNNKQNKECQSNLSHLPRVIYLAPNGETFRSSNDVLRRLAIFEDKKIEEIDPTMSFPDSAFAHPLSKRRRRNIVEIGFGNISCIGSQHSIIEAEILHGETVHGTPQCRRLEVENQSDASIQRLLKYSKKDLVERMCGNDAVYLPDQTKNKQCTANYQGINMDVASPFGLLEELFVSHPWRLLLSTILLNKTSRAQADPVLLEFFRLHPDAKSAAKGDAEQISKITAPLGLMYKRARAIIRFSGEYLELIGQKCVAFHDKESIACTKSELSGEKVVLNRQLKVKNFETTGDFEVNIQQDIVSQQEFCLTTKDILGLYNCGQYSADAYQIFIQRQYNIPVSDYALKMYADYQQGRRKILLSNT